MFAAISKSQVSMDSDSKFRFAEQGKQSTVPIVVLGLIAYILIGLLHDCFEKNGLENKEGLPMKTNAKTYFSICSKSILLSVWTMGANLMASALLA
jgi:uncharacterized membrane protein YjgN (DUF898 family)